MSFLKWILAFTMCFGLGLSTAFSQEEEDETSFEEVLPVEESDEETNELPLADESQDSEESIFSSPYDYEVTEADEESQPSPSPTLQEIEELDSTSSSPNTDQKVKFELAKKKMKRKAASKK